MAATKAKRVVSQERLDELVLHVRQTGEAPYLVAKRAGVPRYELEHHVFQSRQRAMDRFLSRPALGAA